LCTHLHSVPPCRPLHWGLTHPEDPRTSTQPGGRGGGGQTDRQLRNVRVRMDVARSPGRGGARTAARGNGPHTPPYQVGDEKCQPQRGGTRMEGERASARARPPKRLTQPRRRHPARTHGVRRRGVALQLKTRTKPVQKCTQVHGDAKTRVNPVQLCNSELQSCNFATRVAKLRSCNATRTPPPGAGTEERGRRAGAKSVPPSGHQRAIRGAYAIRTDTTTTPAHPRSLCVLTFTPCLRAGPYTGASPTQRTPRTSTQPEGDAGGGGQTDGQLRNVRVRMDVARNPGRGGARTAAPGNGPHTPPCS